MTILSNRQGLQGKETIPVICSVRFMSELLSLEEKFKEKETFHIRSDGQRRIIHHVTRADLQLAMTLFVRTNVKGKWEGINRHMLYQTLVDLYEDPVCAEQFYQAFAKFERAGLLQMEFDPVTRQELLTLQQYLEPETQTIGRFVLLHPVVFTKTFTSLPVAAQRWFIEACMNHGGDPKRRLQKNWQNIVPLVHTKTRYQMEKLLSIMTQTPVWQNEHLFAVGQVDRNVLGQKKVIYRVNSKFLPKYEPQTEYHEVAQAKKGYASLARRLKNLLAAFDLEDLVTFREGFCFRQLVHLVKRKSQSYIFVVLRYLKSLYQEHRYFPDDIVAYVHKELQDQWTSSILTLVQQTGLYEYLIPNDAEKQSRIHSFVQAVRHVPAAKLRELFRKSYRILNDLYTRPPVWNEWDYVRLVDWPESVRIDLIRKTAYNLRKDTDAYFQMERKAERLLVSGTPPLEVDAWLRKKVLRLPEWKPVPDVPIDFRLEQFLQPYLPTAS